MTKEQRKLFPHMPEEIFDPWVDARFKSYGWSYPSGDGDVIGWSRKFGVFTLRELSNLRWSHSMHTLAEFDGDARARAHGIIGYVIHGALTDFAKIERTVERFWACAGFISRTGAIPGALAGIRRDAFIDLLDGGHRLAALIHLQTLGVNVPSEIPVWIAQT